VEHTRLTVTGARGLPWQGCRARSRWTGKQGRIKLPHGNWLTFAGIRRNGAKGGPARQFFSTCSAMRPLRYTNGGLPGWRFTR
jgi:hypothetical protein